MKLRDLWPFSLARRDVERTLTLPTPQTVALHLSRGHVADRPEHVLDASALLPSLRRTSHSFMRQRTAVVAFSGAAGGAEQGLHLAGVKVVASIEADPERREVIRRRWGHEVHGDIRALQPTSFAGHLRPWFYWASPPCKDISEVNQKGRGVDGDGLFFDAVRVGDFLRPDWLAFENVDRLRTRGADRVLQHLEALGYAWWALVLGSENAGKDHERRRVVIVARRTDAPDPQGREGRPAGLAWAPARRSAARWLDVGQPGDCRGGLGHLRPEALGRHVRAYDAVPDRVAEFARRAYGDSVDPIIPYVIARSLIDWEEGRRRVEGCAT